MALTLLTFIQTASRPGLGTLFTTSNKTMCPHDSSLVQGQGKQRGSSCPPGHSRVEVCRNWVEPMGGTLSVGRTQDRGDRGVKGAEKTSAQVSKERQRNGMRGGEVLGQRSGKGEG